MNVFADDDLRFLREMARDVVEASRVKPDRKVGNSPPNTLGHTVIRPGGRDCYPAVWVRDFVMSLDSNLISDDEQRQHLELFAKSQNGASERRLNSGAIIPPHAIPDHINFDGGTVFYPGGYSAGEDQGGEPFGVLPPTDDHFDFIHLGHRVGANDHADRFVRAFDAVESDPATGGMVTTSEAKRAVGFGFCDTVHLTGAMLYPSLLRHRAATELAELVPARRDEFLRIARDIQAHLVPVFSDPEGKHGWLFAATKLGRQPDVWGTLLALHHGVLPEDFARRARTIVADALKRGTIALEGGVRHVPTDFDVSKESSWEKVVPGVAINTYQNGAYWHTPTGWLISALLPNQPDLAKQVFAEYIAHLRQNDFHRGGEFGGPWECFFRDGRHRQNAVYMCSVTTPLGVIEQLKDKQ
jgi:hypothetical protein